MKSIIVISAVLCTALCPGWGKEDEDEWTRLMTKGLAHDQAGSYAAAAACFGEAVHAVEQFPTDTRLALALNSLARANDELGRYLDAERLYRRALMVFEKAGDRESPRYAVLLGNLGSLYVENGQVATGLAMLRESLAMHLRLLEPGHEKIAAICNGLAEALLSQGKYKEAEQRLNEADEILEKMPEHKKELAITLSNLAVIKREQGRNQEAERLLTRSLELFQNEVGTDHPLLIRGLNNLATVYGATRRRDQADATFRQALGIAEKHLGVTHPTYATVLLNYSAFLHANGRKAEAKTLQIQSMGVLRDNARRNGLGLTVDASTLRAK